MSTEIANEILNQLGGKRFSVITGSREYMAGKNYLTFRPGKNSKKVTHVRITLNEKDLYDVEFMNARKWDNIKKIAEVKDVYCDMLHDVFTEHTGLYTTLF